VEVLCLTLRIRPAGPGSLCGILLAGLLILSGCTRSHYREQADIEVYQAIAHKAESPQWPLTDPGITPGPDSRMFDPFNPDHPPMPPDDPAAHKLMHVVDCKEGYKYWHKNGDAPGVEFPSWRNWLVYDSEGQVVLDLPTTIDVAYRNSREYQRALENLYLSALDVTFERFRFDAQFFAGSGTTYTTDGQNRPGGPGRSVSELAVLSDAEVRKLTSSGGEFVVGLANSLVWQFSGPNDDLFRTVLDFSIVQPLLRFGGRAVVLERLTQSERDLLANVRQMFQYRQGFFIEIVTGRNSGEAPTRTGRIGANGLGLLAGFPSGRTGTASAGGLFGLLQDQQEIRNQEANVAGLRSSLLQLEAVFEAGRINRLQVDQARQALYNAQSSLLTAQAAYDSRLDAFKITLGLPPALDVVISDPLLKRFELIDPNNTLLQEAAVRIVDRFADPEWTGDAASLEQVRADLMALRPDIEAQLDVARGDIQTLRQQLPAREARLESLQSRVEVAEGDLDPEIYRVDIMRQRVEQVTANALLLKDRLEALWAELDVLGETLPELDARTAQQRLRSVATRLSGLLLELSLDQASTRLESITLTPIRLNSEDAFEIARMNRLDWMNARARVVDAWRQIEVDANALKSDLNVTVSGDIQTKGDNPIRFRSDTGRLRLGVEFDSPITRVAERNLYRETLIEYQRARRDYMLFEDRISQSLRNTLRIIELSQLNFELRRGAVRVAIAQVDQARLRLNEPAKPGAQSQFSATTARDLVSALRDLLDAQNDFLNTWVNYEVLRMLLQFELGLIQLDERGVWIDPGPIDMEGLSIEPDPGVLPPILSPLVDPADSDLGPDLPPAPGLDATD